MGCYNAARGQVVDTDALFEALEQGRIAYAALDTTDPEPLPGDRCSHPMRALGVFTTCCLLSIQPAHVMGQLAGTAFLHCTCDSN